MAGPFPSLPPNCSSILWQKKGCLGPFSPFVGTKNASCTGRPLVVEIPWLVFPGYLMSLKMGERQVCRNKKSFWTTSVCWGSIPLADTAWLPGVHSKGRESWAGREGECFPWLLIISTAPNHVRLPPFPGSPDIVRGITVWSSKEVSLPGLPSAVLSGIRKRWVCVTFFCWIGGGS